MKMRMIYEASETGLSHPFLVEEVLKESPAKFPNPNPRKFELAAETPALETTVREKRRKEPESEGEVSRESPVKLPQPNPRKFELTVKTPETTEVQENRRKELGSERDCDSV